MSLPPPPLPQCQAPPTLIATVGDRHQAVALHPQQPPPPPQLRPPPPQPPPLFVMVATVHRPSPCIRMATT